MSSTRSTSVINKRAPPNKPMKLTVACGARSLSAMRYAATIGATNEHSVLGDEIIFDCRVAK